MRFVQRRFATRIGLVSLIALFGAGSARAELAAWDQARVTSIAQQLTVAAQGWETQTREEMAGSIGDAEEQDSLPRRARTLREMIDSLAAHLAKGDGHDKTLDQYKSIKEIVDDTQEAVERSEMEAPMTAAWTKVTGLLAQIAPFYDPKAAAGK